MWHIFKAEFRYVYKNILLMAGFIIPGALFYFQISDTAGVSNVLSPLTIATILQFIIFRSIEKRDRQSVLLPFSIRQIAIARILLFLIPCFSLYGLYFILHLVFKDFSPRWNHDIYDLMMFFGLTLVGSSIYFIQHDLIFSFLQKNKNPELDISVLIVLIAVVCLGIPLALAPVLGYTGNLLRGFCFISGLVFIYPAVTIFERRKSYIE